MEEVWKNVLAGADAAGASAPQLADLGTALYGASGGAVGFTEEMADAAVKAAIFQEALGNLTTQWKAGDIDTSEFVTAVNDVVTTLEGQTLEEIEAELNAKFTVIPHFEEFDLNKAAERFGVQEALALQQEFEVDAKVNLTTDEAAIANAIGLIEGVPLEQETVLTVNNDDVITKVGVSTDAIFGLTSAKHEAVLEVNNNDVTTTVDGSFTVVGEFVDARHEAVLLLNIDSVETGVEDANRLISSLPSSRTIHLNFTSNLAAIIDEARRAGALP
jgi:hypothetical protein